MADHFDERSITGIHAGHAAAVALAMLLVPASFAGETRQVAVRNVTRTNVNGNVNVTRNLNVNRHVDVDIVVDDHRHPLGTAAAIAATAVVVGTIVRSLPPSCTAVQIDAVVYQQCGSTWYRPQYAGSTVQYVVCWRRPNSDPLCRSNFDPGLMAGRWATGCG